jgi:hypothetical protein
MKWIYLIAAGVAGYMLWKGESMASILPGFSYVGAAPAPTPGYYGPVWKDRLPPGLPPTAPSSTQPGQARDYALQVAESHSSDPAWIAAVDHIGKKESGHTMGRPADRFAEPDRKAWGWAQYFRSAAKYDSMFGTHRGQFPWDMPWEIQVTAPVARFFERYGKGKAAGGSEVAGVGAIFLHQAKPAWVKHYLANLQAGQDWRTAIRNSDKAGADPRGLETVIRHTETAARAGGAGGVWATTS